MALADAIGKALAAAEAVEPKTDTEQHHIDFVRAALADCAKRVELLPDILETEKKARDVLDAHAAYVAAQAAQTG